MKTILLIIVTGALTSSSHAEEFTRWSTFKSPDAFVGAAKVFKPATDHTELTACFTTRELGQPEADTTGTPVPAKVLSDCTALWADQTDALIFATATPPTQATRTMLGVLFHLTYRHNVWQIADLLSFATIGKYANISATLTAEADEGNLFDGKDFVPVVTIKEMFGGAYSYNLSASYTLDNSKLRRRELE